MSGPLELTLADGCELDIPAKTVRLIEGVTADFNPNFPDAKSFIVYSLGNEIKTGLLIDTVEDLVRMLDINVRPEGWVKATQADRTRIVTRAELVVSRMALKNEHEPAVACEMIVAVGSNLYTYKVRETRAEIKEQMDPPAAPPPVREPVRRRRTTPKEK